MVKGVALYICLEHVQCTEYHASKGTHQRPGPQFCRAVGAENYVSVVEAMKNIDGQAKASIVMHPEQGLATLSERQNILYYYSSALFEQAVF